MCLIKSAEHKTVIIPANGSVVLQGYIDNICHIVLPVLYYSIQKYPMYHQTWTLLQPLSTITINTETQYQFISQILPQGRLTWLTFSQKPTVCKIHLVTIADIQLDISDDNKENLVTKLEVPTEFSKDKVKNVKKLISAYEDVFSKNDTDIGFTS